MKIIGIRIENFRSLHNIPMDGIGDMAILVGANSSGKTNILDCLTLFFNELSPEFERAIGSISDYLWFERNDGAPIRFFLKLELSPQETQQIIPDDVRTQLQVAETASLEIDRQILGPAGSAKWKLERLAINGQTIYGKVVTEEQSKTIPQEAIGRLLQTLTQRFKGKFIYLQSARDIAPPYWGFQQRPSIVRPEALNELRSLGQSQARDHIRQWTHIERVVQEASGVVERMRIVGNEVSIREKGTDLEYPLSQVGGGHQELTALLHELNKQKDCIFGIEEPETHLHPALARQFFEQLKMVSTEKQLFIATHSTVFVDRSDLSSVWIARMKNRETVLARPVEFKDLADILFELGIRPSDFFYADALIFVEGPSDRVIFPMLANKMNINIDSEKISIIPTYGKSKGRYHLKVWSEATKATQAPFFMIFDKDAENEAKQLYKEGLIKRDRTLFLLKKGSLEDYYPGEKFIQAIEQQYDVNLSGEERSLITTIPRVENTEKVLKEKLKELPRAWKVEVGKRVAEAMSVDEIDEELRRILERIAGELRLL